MFWQDSEGKKCRCLAEETSNALRGMTGKDYFTESIIWWPTWKHVQVLRTSGNLFSTVIFLVRIVQKQICFLYWWFLQQCLHKLQTLLIRYVPDTLRTNGFADIILPKKLHVCNSLLLILSSQFSVAIERHILHSEEGGVWTEIELSSNPSSWTLNNLIILK